MATDTRSLADRIRALPPGHPARKYVEPAKPLDTFSVRADILEARQSS